MVQPIIFANLQAQFFKMSMSVCMRKQQSGSHFMLRAVDYSLHHNVSRSSEKYGNLVSQIHEYCKN